MAADSLEQELERRVDALGFEFVELERAGSKARPVLRVRIDRPDSTPGHGVSVDDCIRVSRELEAYLDAREDLPDRYVLEVSSPGLERPLVRRRDFERFAGREVAVRGTTTLAGRGRRLEGVLLGIGGEGADERVRIRLGDGAELEIPRSEIARAHLVYRWDRA
ncbi:MAG: ribosome maturation factor RimP [Gemmatimonadetes bacterium]|nr:ribosome maturation factor RimP [Gemmatimonadota bacterium]